MQQKGIFDQKKGGEKLNRYNSVSLKSMYLQ